MIGPLLEGIAEFLFDLFGETVWKYVLEPIFVFFRWITYHLIGAPFRLLGTLFSWPFERQKYPSFKSLYHAGGNGRIGLLISFVAGMISLFVYAI